MISSRLELVRLDELREHEEVDSEHLRQTLRSIETDGILRNALAVDERTLVVLDGAHRLNALKTKQCRVAPVCLVNYMGDDILVHSMDRKTIVSKDDVINAALSGKKFPPRTTWHMIKMEDGSLEHISVIERDVHLSLAELGEATAKRLGV